MAFKLPADTNPFLLGALVGAVAISWAGFDAFGWTTSRTTESLAMRRADQAVVTALSRICAARFNGEKDLAARIGELQKADRYSRGDVVAKAGYATMTGEKEPVSGVPQACAELLLPEKS